MKPNQGIENKRLTGPVERPEIWIRAIFARNKLPCSDDQLSQLCRYVDLLLEWNKSINLISRRDEENVWESHILHSVSPLFKYGVREGMRILDLGTGGGLPGIPLKILLPKVSMVMVDSTRKKIDVVQSMIADLQLSQTEAVWGRAEELGAKTEFARQFDHVLARGVAPLLELVTLSLPLVRGGSDTLQDQSPSGKKLLPRRSLVAYKGGPLEEEVRKIQGKVRDVHVSELAFEGSEKMRLSDKKVVIVLF